MLFEKRGPTKGSTTTLKKIYILTRSLVVTLVMDDRKNYKLAPL